MDFSMFPSETTIAALATAPGTGGIGIIRISGPDAVKSADQIFRSPSGVPLARRKTHTIHYGYILDASGEKLDQVLVMLMRAPHTYTGEDTVEIQCHGGPYVEEKILERLVSIGVEPADRGEFSKRAFLNGKMDLSQAEVVMDLISSSSEMSRRASMEQLSGSLARRIGEERGRLLELTTMIEANIDYPEYDIEEVTRETMLSETMALLSSLKELYRTADSGIRVREGLRTAIIGSPNVGKSSLMNRLLGRERAIVTQIAGTTRDTLEESVDFDGIPLRLVDTAGIHDTEDTVEKIGVERAKEAAEKADLILWMIDAVAPQAPGEEMLAALSKKQYIILINKEDLVEDPQKPSFLPEDATVIWISAKTGAGIDALQQRIRKLFFDGVVQSAQAPMITNVRQKEALLKAIDALSAAEAAIREGYPEDMIMIDYTNAYDALGEISGHSLKSDVVDEIFRRFCLGK